MKIKEENSLLKKYTYMYLLEPHLRFEKKDDKN